MAHGIHPEEVLRQLMLFQNPPQTIILDRPCVPGDGIQVLSKDDAEHLIQIADEARLSGRLTAFIPASGASSRMFKSLLHFFTESSAMNRARLQERARRGDSDARETLLFLEGLQRFPFFEDLKAATAKDHHNIEEWIDQGKIGPLLAYLLTPQGLDYASLPKALIPFHRYAEGNRTALEEHLAAGDEFLRDREGICRFHITVSPEQQPLFEAFLQQAAPRLEKLLQCRYEVTLSTQRKSSDTLAADLDNRPFRLENGRLLFRPGGHGALLENLEGSGDIVFLNNIDNVVRDGTAKSTGYWRKVLAGCLVELQTEAFQHLSNLTNQEPGSRALERALGFVTLRLSVPPPRGLTGWTERKLQGWMIDRLNRPLRVCGVVQNTGEAGGGPFWVWDTSKELSLQIVEKAQVAPSLDQEVIFSWSTHFNPVSIVCGLRDWKGQPFNLAKFADPGAVFIARKSHLGQELKTLEWPGLWNGGMARWNTVFVEMPLSVFNPVKTINDLLKSGHQPSNKEVL